jgi:transposase
VNICKNGGESMRKKPECQANRVGRPTKLTPELEAEFCALLLEGNYIETACALIGLSKDTVFNWLKKGARGEELEYEQFSLAVKSSLAAAEAADLRAIRHHGLSNWQALAWRLERRFPSRWGKKDSLTAQVDMVKTERTEAVIEHHLMSDAESATLLRELYRRQSSLTGSDITEVTEDEFAD